MATEENTRPKTLFPPNISLYSIPALSQALATVATIWKYNSMEHQHTVSKAELDKREHQENMQALLVKLNYILKEIW